MTWMDLTAKGWKVNALEALPPHRAVPGAVLALAFALGARLLRGVTPSGALAGAAVSYVLYLASPGAFGALISVFVLAWLSTRVGYERKRGLGTAESAEGRTASQVLANLAVSAIAAIGFLGTQRMEFLLGAAAALSEAAADTVASEFGQVAQPNARLITTGEMVPAGTDGGITLAGTAAGLAAAALVSLFCAWFQMIPWILAIFAALAGGMGMLVDSFLGALVERRGYLGNDWVNFLSTAAAAVIAIAFARTIH